MTQVILTLDDDSVTREMLGACLKERGFSVLEAADGRSGLEVIGQHKPELVLCDLRLPDIDGFEIVRKVSEQYPDLPIIVVSVVDELSEAVKAFKLGAWDYITKPIHDLGILEHAVDQALERAELRRKNREYQDYLEATNHQLERSLQKLKEDEQAGRQLQFQLLPPDGLSFDGYHFHHQLWTSLYLSGDFVDYFELDEEYLGFYMADVSGHGVSSAFVTVLLKSYMSRYLELYRQGKNRGLLDPAKIFTRLNRNVLKSNTSKYLTMFYGIVRKSDNRLYYSNGGQFPFPLLYDGERVQPIECKSKPVGLFDFATYQTECLQLPEQFVMFFASDGILDALPEKTLAEKRAYLASQLQETGFETDLLVDRLRSRISGRELPDDITLLLVKKETHNL